MKFPALVSSLMLAALSIGAVSAMLQQPATPPQVPRPPVQLSPSEIELYKRAQTVIDWTPRQIHDCPFLHKLRPTGSQDQLPMVLERVGQTGTLLFHDFPQVSCDEEVFSEAYPGRRYLIKLQKFHYIVIPRPVGDVLFYEEYRTDLKGNAPDEPRRDDFFIITSDFASTWLYLRPADQRAGRFRLFGIQTIRDRECHVVGFAQEPEKVRRPGEFLDQGKSVALLLQGLAWIDSETFQVLRTKTWLLAPRTDVGLKSLTSTVDFYPVQPGGLGRVLWLPRDVTVEAIDHNVLARNTHHYSNFKLFRVESTIKPVE